MSLLTMQREEIRNLAQDLADVYGLAKEELSENSAIHPVLETMEHFGMDSDEAWTLIYEMNLRGITFVKES